MAKAKPYPFDTNLIIYTDGKVWNVEQNKWHPTHKHSCGVRNKINIKAEGHPRLLYRCILLAHNWRDDHANFDAHHINGDPSDDRLDNLVWVPKEVHRKLHK
jgi:hypothetical protein